MNINLRFPAFAGMTKQGKVVTSAKAGVQGMLEWLESGFRRDDEIR
jgi:hypothetical protein